MDIISKYRISQLFDTNKKILIYGVEGLLGKEWCRLANNNGPILFESKKEARTYIKSITKETEIL